MSTVIHGRRRLAPSVFEFHLVHGLRLGGLVQAGLFELDCLAHRRSQTPVVRHSRYRAPNVTEEAIG